VSVRGDLGSIGVRKARERWRDLVKRAQAGEATVLLNGARPEAVLISYEEVQHWRRVEQGLAALHALGVYPEAAVDERELPGFVRGSRQPTARRLRRAQTIRRAILGPLRSVVVSQVPRRFAETLDEVATGQMTTITSAGAFVAALIPSEEYERLRGLVLVESWFGALGLDLASCSPKDVTAWVTRFRDTETQSSG
jgi:prevent-host-death family protein